MRWPDRDGRLVLAAHTERPNGIDPNGCPTKGCTHAALAPDVAGGDGGDPSDLTFRGERNAVVLPTSVLKEIIDDLEWPAAPVAIRLASDPGPSLAFSASGAEVGELRVDVDATDGRLAEFVCREPGRWVYRYRFLKAAMAMPTNLIGPANLPEGKGVPATFRASRFLLRVLFLSLLRSPATPPMTDGPNEGASVVIRRVERAPVHAVRPYSTATVRR